VNEAFAAIVFVPALAVGSFLNVVATRVPARLSLLRPRSQCPACSTQIAWYDNVPIISFMALHGRCRTCKARIPWKYPLVELSTALLVSACVLAFGVTPLAGVEAFFCATLVALTVTDLERRIVPNRIVLPAAAAVLIARTAIDPSVEWAIASLGCALALLLFALAYPGGLGMGDVKLALLLGAALGTTVVVGVMLGMVAALIPSAYLLARHGKAARKMAIPLAPFLAAGALVALFAGHEILNAYLRSR
jgi:leader peptidase (prepilin peptidase) / N-methyltransferase